MDKLLEAIGNVGKVRTEGKALDKRTSSLDSIAEKHGVSMDVAKAALAAGVKVEMEHTSDERVAREIALDHLNEKIDYYKKLKEIEEDVSRSNQLMVEHTLAVMREAKYNKRGVTLKKDEDGELAKKMDYLHHKENPKISVKTVQKVQEETIDEVSKNKLLVYRKKANKELEAAVDDDDKKKQRKRTKGSVMASRKIHKLSRVPATESFIDKLDRFKDKIEMIDEISNDLVDRYKVKADRSLVGARKKHFGAWKRNDIAGGTSPRSDVHNKKLDKQINRAKSDMADADNTYFKRVRGDDLVKRRDKRTDAPMK